MELVIRAIFLLGRVVWHDIAARDRFPVRRLTHLTIILLLLINILAALWADTCISQHLYIVSSKCLSSLDLKLFTVGALITGSIGSEFHKFVTRTGKKYFLEFLANGGLVIFREWHSQIAIGIHYVHILHVKHIVVSIEYVSIRSPRFLLCSKAVKLSWGVLRKICFLRTEPFSLLSSELSPT